MARGSGPSKVEQVKLASRGLRGSLADEVANGAPTFGNANAVLLKFHGIYQGYDRDSATELKQRGLGKQHQLMVRVSRLCRDASGANTTSLSRPRCAAARTCSTPTTTWRPRAPRPSRATTLRCAAASTGSRGRARAAAIGRLARPL